MSNGMFKPLGSSSAGGRSAQGQSWIPIEPVPNDAPPRPETDAKGRKPSLVHEYRDAAGRLLGYVLRFDVGGGEKEFRPLTWCQEKSSSKRAWRWQSWVAPRPLYGLDRLAARPTARVVICEGEKAADAAGRLLLDAVAVASPGGSKSAGKTNWTPLAGRDVTIWPDNDAPGEQYAEAVSTALRGIAVVARIIQPPAEVAQGWDAADLEGDPDAEMVAAGLMRTAATGPSVESDESAGGRNRKRGQLMAMIGDAELWHDPGRLAFATVAIDGHRENLPLASRSFKIWLSGKFYDETGAAPGAQALEDTCRTLEAAAIHHGPEYPTFRRMGEADGRLYLDLGGPNWRAVEIDSEDWRVIDRPPVKFLRSGAARALPEPERCEDDLEAVLRPFLNVETDADFRLIASWLVSSFWSRGPYPIISIGGEQGSGKSGVSKMLRTLLDPNSAAVRATPENLRDLVVSAENSWVLAYDNLSGIPAWLSDALCRLATGAGFAARELHTDREESVFNASRPVILNGIPDLAGRPDLQDRVIGITLPPIPEDKRRSERDVWREFEAALPKILNALLIGVSASIRNLPCVKLDRLPRMADFATVAVAAAPGLGWTGEEFLRDYEGARSAAVALSLEASPLAQALQSFMAGRPGWAGSATDLLTAMDMAVTDATRKAKTWPKTPNDIGGQLRRLAPALRAVGVVIEFIRSGHSRQRVITISASSPQAGVGRQDASHDLEEG